MIVDCVEMREEECLLPASVVSTSTLKRKLSENRIIDEEKFPDYFTEEISKSLVLDASTAVVHIVTERKKKRKRAKRSSKTEPIYIQLLDDYTLEKSATEIPSSSLELSSSSSSCSSSFPSSSSLSSSKDLYLPPLNQTSISAINSKSPSILSKVSAANPIEVVKVPVRQTSVAPVIEESHSMDFSNSNTSVKQQFFHPLGENVAAATISPCGEPSTLLQAATREADLGLESFERKQPQFKYVSLTLLIKYITLLSCLLGGTMILLPSKLSTQLGVFERPVSSIVMQSVLYGGFKWKITSVSALNDKSDSSIELDIASDNPEIVSQFSASKGEEMNSGVSVSNEIEAEIDATRSEVHIIETLEDASQEITTDGVVLISETVVSAVDSQDSSIEVIIQPIGDVGETPNEDAGEKKDTDDSVGGVSLTEEDAVEDSAFQQSDVKSDSVAVQTETIDDTEAGSLRSQPAVETESEPAPEAPPAVETESEPAPEAPPAVPIIPMQEDDASVTEFGDSNGVSDVTIAESSPENNDDVSTISETVNNTDQILCADDAADHPTADGEADGSAVGAADGAADDSEVASADSIADITDASADDTSNEPSLGGLESDSAVERSTDGLADDLAADTIIDTIHDVSSAAPSSVDGINSKGSTSTEEVSSPVAVQSLDRTILDFAVFPRGGKVLKENSKAFDGSVLTSTPYQGRTLLHNNLTTGTPSNSIIGLVKNIVAKKYEGEDRSVLISSSPLAYGNCYYLSMAAGRNMTISMHSAIIPTKIVLQHIISATTDENGKSCAPREVRVRGWSKDPRSGLFEDKRKARGISAVDLGEYNFSWDGPSWSAVEGSLAMTAKEEFSLPALDIPVQTVTLSILSNHGHDHFVCLYRIQVHGFLL